MQTKSLYTEFYDSIKSLESTITGLNVYLTDIDIVDKFPALTVRLGSDSREENTKQSSQFTMQMFVDVYVQANATNKATIDTQMLDIRDAIESKISSTTFTTSGFFKIEFISQSEPNALERGEFYKTVTNIEYQITYFKS